MFNLRATHQNCVEHDLLMYHSSDSGSLHLLLFSTLENKQISTSLVSITADPANAFSLRYMWNLMFCFVYVRVVAVVIFFSHKDTLRVKVSSEVQISRPLDQKIQQFSLDIGWSQNPTAANPAYQFN